MSTLKKLSEITGFKPADMDQILIEVKANQALLESCPRHDFSIILDRYTKQPISDPTPAHHFGAKFKCSHCSGIVDFLAKRWYDRGLKHGQNVSA